MYFKIILIALIVFACLIIAYPETRLGLKELIKKHPFLSGSLLCLVLVIITFLYFPPFFRLVAIDFWEIPLTVYKDGTVEVVELADLGSIGDIFGSLNSFISSIALCAVAFSTWLQVTSLRETRESNRKQLLLAQEAHDEQIKESQLSNFTNSFYALLNYKNSQHKNLVFENKIDGKTYNGSEVFRLFYNKFNLLLRTNWKDWEVDQFNKQNVKQEFDDYVLEAYGGYYPDIYTYFHVYVEILQLITTSKISNNEKKLYKNILINSMSLSEQVTLFWIGAYIVRVDIFIRGNRIFHQFYQPAYENFAFKFYDESCFATVTWKRIFSRKPPA